MKWAVELNVRQTMSQEQADAAIEFGVELSDGQTDAKLYILAFLQTLLHQRQKLDLGLLANYLKPTIVKAWNEVLSILEARKRKVLNIQSGSLIFTLFCPTQESSRQLQDDTWIKTAIQKLQELIRTLGKRMNALLNITITKRSVTNTENSKRKYLVFFSCKLCSLSKNVCGVFCLGVEAELTVLQPDVPRVFSETNLLLRLQELGLSEESEVCSEDSQSTDRDTGFDSMSEVGQQNIYPNTQITRDDDKSNFRTEFAFGLLVWFKRRRLDYE